MSTSQSQYVQPQRYAVRFGDRTLPLSASPPADGEGASQEVPYEVLQTEAALAELSQFLQQEVTQQVLTAYPLMNSVTLKQAIERYAAHMQRLHQFCNEWSAMLARIIQFKGSWKAEEFKETTSDQLELEISNWRAELLSEAEADCITNETIVTAKLAVKPLAEVKLELSKHVEESITRSKNKMLDQLVTLVDRQVLGIVEWYAPDACCYHHYIRECDLELGDFRIAFNNTYIGLGKFRKKQTLHADGTAKRSLVRRIQHLVNARALSLGQTTFPIPRYQAEVIADLPAWIAPSIQVVEGTLIRETIITQDQGCQDWAAEQVLEDTIYWHNDPGLVLGPFVLSGWGQKEIEAEVALREQEAQAVLEAQQPVHRIISTYKMLGYLSLAAACVFVVSWRFSAANLVGGMVCGVAASALLSGRWNKESKERDESDYAIGYAVSVVTTSLLAMLLVPAGVFTVGIVFFLLALLALALYAHRTSDWDEIREDSQPAR